MIATPLAVRDATNKLVIRLMMLNTGFGRQAIARVWGRFLHWLPMKNSMLVFTVAYWLGDRLLLYVRPFS